MARRDQEIARKLRVLEHAERTGNIRKTCRYFGVPRSNFYNWKKRFEQEGELGLARKTPVTIAHPRAIAPEIVEKVLHLRQTYHLGPIRIVWYLKRYHDIQISESSVSRILKRRGLNRLPSRVGRRAVHTHRYAKQVPGHHVQMDNGPEFTSRALDQWAYERQVVRSAEGKIGLIRPFLALAQGQLVSLGHSAVRLSLETQLPETSQTVPATSLPR